MLRLVVICGLLAAFIPTLTLQPALAAGVVGNGNPASCTETAFNNALAGGGLVTFNCGLGQVTINLTTIKVIANDTQIDGDGLIFLNMGDNDRHFYVAPGITLRLDEIRLDDGAVATDGGAIWNDGTVIATDVVFGGNFAPGNGGAIRNDGTLVVTDGFFTVNVADGLVGGGSIYNTATGTTSIMGDTTFIAGLADFGDGGAIFNDGGTLSVSGTATFNNITGDNGGAIANDAGGTVTIDGAHFVDNGAVFSGGAVSNALGTVSISNSTFDDNEAVNGHGGAIYNASFAGTMTLDRSELFSNDADLRGGGIWNGSIMTVSHTDVSFNNAADAGGGINNALGGNLTITRSALNGNTALTEGGGLRNEWTVELETSTISGNSATGDGGGIANLDALTVANSTLAYNFSGGVGGGIRNGAIGAVGITNTIVTNNTGGDCSNGGALNSGDFNLDGDGTCSFLLANDISGGNANLQPFANNGGLTGNHLPGPGSDAIDNGPAACASPDQRGQIRPQNGFCDIGAVEVIPPADVCFNSWTSYLQQPVGGECNGPYLQKVVFEDNGPHYLCAGFGTGILTYSYAPTCLPNNTPAISMPAAAPLGVCLKIATGQYRLPPGGQPCSAGEFAVVLQ